MRTIVLTLSLLSLLFPAAALAQRAPDAREPAADRAPSHEELTEHAERAAKAWEDRTGVAVDDSVRGDLARRTAEAMEREPLTKGLTREQVLGATDRTIDFALTQANHGGPQVRLTALPARAIVGDSILPRQLQFWNWLGGDQYPVLVLKTNAAAHYFMLNGARRDRAPGDRYVLPGIKRADVLVADPGRPACQRQVILTSAAENLVECLLP
ncbi:MAG: hypothetical protein JSR45_03490 [Proteobacteria bacterium]|nr:hypothetical protein [Pseudomonadota bacterium]